VEAQLTGTAPEPDRETMSAQAVWRLIMRIRTTTRPIHCVPDIALTATVDRRGVAVLVEPHVPSLHEGQGIGEAALKGLRELGLGEGSDVL